MNRLNLRYQVFRHRAAICLVFGVHFIPEGLAFGIKNAGQVVCLDLGPSPPHHINHAVNRSGGLSSRISEVWHAMKGPIQVAGAVYQQESMFSHTAIVQSSYLLVANSLPSWLRSWLEIT